MSNKEFEVPPSINFMLTGEDKDGNKYSLKGNRIKVEFAKGDVRDIGCLIDYNGDIAYVKKEDENHRFRAMDAWSINDRVLNLVDWVFYHTELDSYKISQLHALRHGKTLNYTNESKVYVPVKFWTKKSEVKHEQKS